MLGVLRAELPTLSPPLWLNMDEGYATAMALRLVKDGGLPYTNAVDQRGPVMAWVYELAVQLGGAFDLHVVRYTGLLFAELTVLGVFAATRAIRRGVGAGIAAFLFALHLAVFKNPFDSLALNGELIALPFILFGFAALARKRVELLLLGGMLVTLGFFAKQTLGGHIVVAAVWVLLPSEDRVRRFAWFAGGVLATCAVILSPYALTGELHTFRYYFTTYGRMAYLAPTTHDDIVALTVSYYVRQYYGFLLLGGALLVWRSGLAARIAILNAVVAIPETVLTGRPLWHYFLPFEALASIVVGLAIASRAHLVSDRLEPFLRGAVALVLAVLLVVWPKGPSILMSGEPAMPHDSLDPAKEPLGRWLEAHTEADDRLFVWGFRADVHTSGRRWPASRFVYCIFQSGFTPWIPQPLDVEEKRMAEGSREQTLADLETTHAEIIIDA
jgi:hypothetical protein